jgi:3alpha(or 20beta)-hydroxysteroid dehydrogenase
MKTWNLAGRRALVTGAARGLGAGMAEALVAAGASVMIGDIMVEAGQAMAKALAEKSTAESASKVGFVALDVTDEASWENAVAATIAELGGYDILINNAGIEITSLVVDVKPDDLRRMYEVNVIGTALGMKHAFLAMRPQGAAGRGGAIVNISSATANVATPSVAGYSATKSAIDRMTRVAAVEAGKFGYGVRVNCIYPGLVQTDMGSRLTSDVVAAGLFPSEKAVIDAMVNQTPLGRLGEVSDMADAVIFLCSDAAHFITGTGLPVDGGIGA